MDLQGKCPHCNKPISIHDIVGGESGYREQLRAEVENQIADEKKIREEMERNHKIALSEMEKRNSDALAQAVTNAMNGLQEKLANERQTATRDMQGILATVKESAESARKQAEDLQKQLYEARESANAERMKAQQKEMERLEEMQAEKARLQETLKNEVYSQVEQLRQENDRLKNNIQDLNKKAVQGLNELQGEAIELDIEETLRSKFVYDKIEPVPKGVTGADVIQTVVLSEQEIGKIVWEIKNTKNWSEEWVTKLLEDTRRVGGSVSLLATAAFPREHQGKLAASYKGVYLVSFSVMFEFATALRDGIIATARARSFAEARQDAAGMVYDYVTSPGFAQIIDALNRTYQDFNASLEKEEATAIKNFAMRRAQISKMSTLTMTMFGSMKALAGQTAELASLEEQNVSPVVSNVTSSDTSETLF